MDLLIEIGDEELALGHPPINCLAVNNKRDSIPGPRFYFWYSQTFNEWIGMKSIPAKKELLDSLIADCHDYWADVMTSAV
jgi:hypothetical protein